MKDGWKRWEGGECPIDGAKIVEVVLRNGKKFEDISGCYRWSKQNINTDIMYYRVVPEAERAQSEQKPHSHYHKDVSHLSSIDVYRVLDLFGVTDQAIGHAAKKLLVAGGRGLKDIDRDIDDVIDTLNRWKEMRKEDAK